MANYVFAAESGVRLAPNGNPVHYTAGEAWEDTDPFVVANRGLFTPTPPKVRSTERPEPAKPERIERATRRPGESR